MSMRPGEKVLAAPEELGLDSRTVFRRAATELLEQLAEGAGRLVIDLAGTRQIDSAGLGALMLIQRSEEHTSELQSLRHLVCRLLLEKKKNIMNFSIRIIIKYSLI